MMHTMHTMHLPSSKSRLCALFLVVLGLSLRLSLVTGFGILGILCLRFSTQTRGKGTRKLDSLKHRSQPAKPTKPTDCESHEVSRLRSLSTKSMKPWSGMVFWKAVMILNSACWGSAFIATKAGIEALQTAGIENAGPVFGFLRFALATFPLLPWLGQSTSIASAAMSCVVGLIWGTSYACTFLSYTLGTTGAKAAFITSLQSLVVAACTSMVASRLQCGTIVSALLAVLGVAFIELNGSLSPSIGDVICIAAPICVGLGWYVLDKNMKKYPNDFIPSVVIQFFVFTVVFGIWLFKGQNLSEIRHWFADLPHLLRTPNLLCPLLFASILGNLLTMMSANVACRYLHVSDVSLIVTTEPLFAAVAAACCIGETFSLGDCIGGFFIMAALLCNELWGDGEEDHGTNKLNPTTSVSSISTTSTFSLSNCESGHFSSASLSSA